MTGQCSNTSRTKMDKATGLPTFKTYRCRSRAVTARKDFRWGKAGEPAIVPLRFKLCAACARAWDDHAADGAAEAAAS